MELIGTIITYIIMACCVVGADPVLAAAFIMAPDCGSFALATEIGQTPDLFPLIIATGFMCASTISFNVPIGLSMLEKEDHKYLALGLKLFPNGMVKGFKVFGKIMTGTLTAVVVACIVQHYTGLFTDVSPEAASGGPLAFVHTGDIIAYDIPHRTLDLVGVDGVECGAEEATGVLEQRAREEEIVPRPPRKGLYRRYTAQALSAMEGAGY